MTRYHQPAEDDMDLNSPEPTEEEWAALQYKLGALDGPDGPNPYRPRQEWRTPPKALLIVMACVGALIVWFWWVRMNLPE